MVGNLLLRGMLVGVLAGLLAFGFARIFGFAADTVYEPGQSIVLKDRQALRGSCPQRATASRSVFRSATLRNCATPCRRRSSASPDHGADVRRRSRPRIRRGD